MWVVRVALQRPYSFVVLALLANRDIRRTGGVEHAGRHLPEPQHSGRQRGLDRQRSVAERHVRSRACQSGARARSGADQVLGRRLSALKPPRAVPVDVLRNRPDVAQSERLTAAASELIDASRANFFPKFTLLALGGTQDTKFTLFEAINLFGTVGPSIDFPLFDAGLRQAELEIAKSQFTEAAENYRSTVLRALKEIQDELSSLRWLAEEYDQTTTAAVAARKAADLSLILCRDGASGASRESMRACAVATPRLRRTAPRRGRALAADAQPTMVRRRRRRCAAVDRLALCGLRLLAPSRRRTEPRQPGRHADGLVDACRKLRPSRATPDLRTWSARILAGNAGHGLLRRWRGA